MALLQSSEVQTAIDKLAIDDYAGKGLLETIKQGIDNGARVEDTTQGALEIQKIISDLDYDFKVLNDWTHGELQVLMFQVQASPNNSIQAPDIQRATPNLAADDYAGRAILQDIVVLLNAGINIPGNSSGGIEISKLIAGQAYDFDALSTWIDVELESIGTSLKITRIEDFQTVVTGNIVILEQKGDAISQMESDFLAGLTIFEKQIQALGITRDEVALYEAFIGAKMIGQIDGNGNPVAPQVGLALSGLELTRAQKVFNGVGDNIVGGALESAYSWMVPSHRPYEPIPSQNTGGELQVQDVKSVFLTLIQANTELQSGEITVDTLKDFQGAASTFVEDILNMRRITVGNQFINPNYVVGLQSLWFDDYEDNIGTDYESEGKIAQQALDGFHGTNGPKMSLDQLAQIGLEYNFDYTLITESSINDIIDEMRDGGPRGQPLNNAEVQRLTNILKNLTNFNTRNIIDPLQSELEYLQGWSPPMHYDPYIRIGQGTTGNGGIVSYESYGPYSDPREKALMITMHLSVLHGLEKDPGWKSGYIAAALWTLNAIDIVPGFEDGGLLFGAAITVVSYNMLFTTLWKRGSHARMNLSSLNPRNLLSVFRGGNPEEAEITNAEPQWHERLSEAEKRTYAELVNSHSEVNTLGTRDQGKLKDIITLMTIADDLGDATIYGDFKELGRKLLDNPPLTLRGSAAYANERFWNMRLFQIISRGGVSGNGVYQFFFDNNSLRAPRITGDNGIGLNTGTPGSDFGPRVGSTLASIPSAAWNNRYLGGALNLRNTQAFNRSPIFHSTETLTLDSWKSMFFERYRAVNNIFQSLKDYEKYRPDYANDSELESKIAEVEEMRTQFLRGNIVELDASGDAVRNSDGKLQFVASSETPDGNRRADFEKFLKNWMQTGDPDFDLEYGKALKADAITSEERTNSRLTEHLERAQEYANSRSSTAEKETMLQRISILNDRLTETGEIPEGSERAPYSDFMTKTEFYQRLSMIMNNDGKFNDGLAINDKAEFNAAKAEVGDALRSNTPRHMLAKLFSAASVAEETARAAERAFSPRNLYDIETGEGKVLLKAELYALAEGDTAMLDKLSNISTLTQRRSVMNGFMEVLTDKIGIPDTVNFDRTVDAFRSDATRNIITIGSERYYIENLTAGENGSIQSRVTDIKAQQERDRVSRLRDATDSDRTIINSVLHELNGGDDGSRSITTRQILLDTIKRIF